MNIPKLTGNTRGISNPCSTHRSTENKIMTTLWNTNATASTKLDPAGIWAAKEAFVKALGTGFRGVGFQDISVLRDRRGKPVLSLSPRAQALAGGGAIDVSISHDRTQAVAFVVML